PASSMTPLAFEDTMTPAPKVAASVSISWPAPWAPAPAMMSGRRQAARASAAVSMWSASALGSGRVTDGWDRPGPVASRGSRGISIAAGHLRPARMADSVCPTARDTSPGRATRWTSVSTAARAPDWLRTSWRRPLPRPGWVRGMPGQMRSTGTESVKDWSRAVSALSTAGPVVMTTTLTSPVRRAAPSAMCPAPCSCRGETMSMPSADSRAKISRLWVPGIPNTRVMPSAFRTRARWAPPVMFACSISLLGGVGDVECVDGQRAGFGDPDRVDLDLGDLIVRGDEPGDGDGGLGEPVEVGRRSAAPTGEQAVAGQPGDHLEGLGVGDGGESEPRVAVEFGLGSAGTDHDDGPEVLVPASADEDLDDGLA